MNNTRMYEVNYIKQCVNEVLEEMPENFNKPAEIQKKIASLKYIVEDFLPEQLGKYERQFNIENTWLEVSAQIREDLLINKQLSKPQMAFKELERYSKEIAPVINSKIDYYYNVLKDLEDSSKRLSEQGQTF